MRFGIFYEHQLPKPWKDGDEEKLLNDAIDQVVLADELGIDNVWAVEHHFLEEYSHSSAPEVFLAACAARTKRIRIGHGIKHTPANYNHPARVAEEVATLDLISRGRVEFGIGEGATRMELGGFKIPAREKRAMSIEAGEQIANMMAMTPYPLLISWMIDPTRQQLGELLLPLSSHVDYSNKLILFGNHNTPTNSIWRFSQSYNTDDVV